MKKRFLLRTGKTILVDVNEDESVKDKLQAKQGIPQNQQQLIFVEDTSSVQEASEQAKLIKERSKDIQKMAKDLEELKEIMQDLTLMVNHQGEMVDLIDVHINQTATATTEAVVELTKAKKHQKRSTCITM